MKLHLLIAQRKQRFDGEYGLEALACMTEYDADANGEYLPEQARKAAQSGEFDAHCVVALDVSERALRGALYPALTAIPAEVVGAQGSAPVASPVSPDGGDERPFAVSAKPVDAARALGIAAELERVIGEIANGVRKPGALPLDALVELIQYARDTAMAPAAHPDAEAAVAVALAAERERLAQAIKDEDDHCSDGDYMMDSKDCIAVIRGQWKRPEWDVPATPSSSAG